MMNSIYYNKNNNNSIITYKQFVNNNKYNSIKKLANHNIINKYNSINKLANHNIINKYNSLGYYYKNIWQSVNMPNTQNVNTIQNNKTNMRNNNTKITKQLPKDKFNTCINGKITSVKLTKILGKGGEGTVYDCQSYNLNGKYVAKIYHKCDINTENKIKYMINNKPTKIESDTFRICWPEFIITNEHNKFCGYIMKKGFDNSIELYHLTKEKIKIQEFKKFENKYKNAIFEKMKILFYTCVPIYHILNSGKYVMVDIKPQNILTDKYGKISILDTDSFQISENNKVIYNAKVITPEYTPKEYANVTPAKIKYNVTTDMFAISVTFYQILMGIHPYVIRPKNDKLTTIADFIYNDLFAHGNNDKDILGLPKPHQTFEALDNRIQNLFIKSFTTINRPNIKTWGETLGTVINELANNTQNNTNNNNTQNNSNNNNTRKNTQNIKIIKDAIDNINKSKELLTKYKNNSIEEQINNNNINYTKEEQIITEMIINTNNEIYKHITKNNIVNKEIDILNKIIFLTPIIQWKYLTGFITKQEIIEYDKCINNVIKKQYIKGTDILEISKKSKDCLTINKNCLIKELEDSIEACKVNIVKSYNNTHYINYIKYDMITKDILSNKENIGKLYEDICKYKLHDDVKLATTYINGILAITLNQHLNNKAI